MGWGDAREMGVPYSFSCVPFRELYYCNLVKSRLYNTRHCMSRRFNITLVIIGQ